jgi:hypothetical protein
MRPDFSATIAGAKVIATNLGTNLIQTATTASDVMAVATNEVCPFAHFRLRSSTDGGPSAALGTLASEARTSSAHPDNAITPMVHVTNDSADSMDAFVVGARTGQPFWQDESFDHWVRNQSEFDRVTADRAVLLFCFLPGAYVLSFSSPDSLLVLAAAICLLNLTRGHWVVAGVAGALATATRPVGLAVVVCAVVAAPVEVGEGDVVIGGRRSWLERTSTDKKPRGVASLDGSVRVNSQRR